MIKFLPGLRTLFTALPLLALLFLGAGPARAADDDINTLFQMGRAAFYRGDLELARDLLKQVQAKNPQHFETRALLAQIQVSLNSTNQSSLKKTYESVILPKVDFEEVTVPEALEGLRVLSKNASAGKVIPNFIVQDQTLNSKSLSLHLTNVPLGEAISYVARVVGCRAMYETHAVVFTSAPEPEPTAAKN
jgi:hypothetical protein